MIKIASAVDIGVFQNEHDPAHEEEDEPLPLGPEQFQKAAEEGWFGDRKVELLDGDVYEHSQA